jgi:hypothetical protein
MTGTARPAKKQDTTTIALLLVASMIAIGGIAFAVGRVSAGTVAAAPTAALGRGGFGAGRSFAIPSLAPGQTFDISQFGGGRGGAGVVAGGIQGTVQSINGTTLTIALTSGSTMTIDLTGTTTYHNEVTASQSDVTVGSTVRVTVGGGSGTGGNPAATPAPGTTAAPRTATDVTVVTP